MVLHFHKYIYFLALVLMLGCNKNGYDNPNRNLKKHIFEEQEISMGFPDTWEIRNSKIYINDEEPVGDISIGILKVEEEISTEDFLERLENGGPDIHGEDNSYAFSRNSFLTNTDQIRAGGRKWLIARTETFLEGPKEPGTWFTYYFISPKKEDLLFINIYTRKLYPFDRQFIKDILATVEVD